MSRDEENYDDVFEGGEEFVPAIFARSEDDADAFRELLEEHDIPAVIGEEEPEGSPARRGMTRGLPVLVPEALLDEASEVLAGHSDTAEFVAPDEELLEEDDEEDEYVDDDGEPVAFDEEDDEDDLFGDEDDEDDDEFDDLDDGLDDDLDDEEIL